MSQTADAAAAATPEKSTTPLTVALVGNPNTGKTTIFNTLCGANQAVGNYPGVTVEKKTGRTRLGDRVVNLIDLPGIYSLNPQSPDERIAVDVAMGRVKDTPRPDAVVFILDATNLKRNLLLYSQLVELDLPIVIALTMTDLLAREHIELDIALLRERLGAPLTPIVGGDREGLARLGESLFQALANEPPRLPRLFPETLEQAVDRFETTAPNSGLSRFEIRNLLSTGGGAVDPDCQAAADRLRADLPAEALLSPSQAAAKRYQWAQRIVDGVETRRQREKRTWSERIDAVLIHRFYGLAFFAAVMFVVFKALYSWAGPLMDLIESGMGALGGLAGSGLGGAPILQSLLVDGFIGGVGAVVVFLPQILILFVFIAFLEDSGYLARAAFLMDKLIAWTGLNGRAFIPMLSGFACAVPAIMATRVMPDPKARTATILITPLMSCSARLPVYVLLIGAFIEPQFGAGWAAFTLFAMHALGLLAALPIAWFLNRNLLKTPTMPFVLEMPPYRMPKLRNVTLRAGQAGLSFVTKAGTIILACTVVIWALSFFPRPASVAERIEARYAQTSAPLSPDRQAELEREKNNEIAGAYLEQSYLGRTGKAVQPIFAPLGFDWKITVGVLGAFPAREVIIATLGIIYNVGEADEGSADLKSRMRQERRDNGTLVFTPLTAIALMVFFAFCSQCMSTLATIRRELNSWGWTVFVFVYMTALAYVLGLAIYQLGGLLGFA